MRVAEIECAHCGGKYDINLDDPDLRNLLEDEESETPVATGEFKCPKCSKFTTVEIPPKSPKS